MLKKFSKCDDVPACAFAQSRLVRYVQLQSKQTSMKVFKFSLETLHIAETLQQLAKHMRQIPWRWTVSEVQLLGTARQKLS